MFDADTMNALTLYARTQRLMFELEAAERELGNVLRVRDINMEMYRARAAEIEIAFEMDRRSLPLLWRNH
jgi:hypothetical protein